VTAHYINEDCILQSYLLDCFECSDQRHTGDYLNQEIKKVLESLNIDNKVIAGVSDHAHNIGFVEGEEIDKIIEKTAERATKFDLSKIRNNKAYYLPPNGTQNP
jgi:hypothetical protein